MVVISICLCWNVLLGFLLWWHRELFFGWPTVGANVGGGGLSEKFGRVPLTRERERVLNMFKHSIKTKGDSESPNSGTSSKGLNPFTRALTPPFIGSRRDFYIPKSPSSSKNIPNVNTYNNVFFISHIYKPATSSHSKPGLFGTITLTLLLLWFVNFSAHDFRTRLPTDSRISCPPKFVTLPVWGSRLSRVHDSESSPTQDPRKSHVREPEASQVQDSRKSWMPCSWKTYLKNFVKLDVSRVMSFPKFPNSG
jgi:hypothetical protein